VEKQTYLWYVPRDAAAHVSRLVDIGVEHVRIKAGGDTGRLWEQWANPAATQPYRAAGLRVTPWFYTWPVQSDIDVVIRAMRAQPFDEYALNPETEWRTQSRENPWRTLADANAGAAAWLARMEAALPGVRRAFSGVPSWLDFPYEAWCAGCHQAEPQHYWPRHLLSDWGGQDLDQVGFHRRRGGDALPCVPLLTASREYDDAGVVALARVALADFPTLDGFSAWEAGNAAFQWEAMRAAYRLLPDIIRREVGPAGEFARSYVDPQTGEPVTLINWGGAATHVEGTNFADVGISVGGIPDGVYDRSIQGNAFGPWVRRP
jgi:hypothetical protein